jgi:hypothetical protein
MLSRLKERARRRRQAKLKARILRPIKPSNIRRLENGHYQQDENGMVVATIK